MTTERAARFLWPRIALKSWTLALGLVMNAVGGAGAVAADVTRAQVEEAIRQGVRYLKSQQKQDGSWRQADNEARTGSTSLATLALLTAGETVKDAQVGRALDFLRQFGPEDLRSTYDVSLQTMVFAAADPERDKLRLTRNVAWLEAAQIKLADRVPWPGTWTYSASKTRQGDNSNTQYALLGLHAAAEVGIPVKTQIWALSREHFLGSQNRDGSWGYTPLGGGGATGSMTCAGVSSLVITGLKRFTGREVVVGETINGCGEGGFHPDLQRGLDWLAVNFSVGQNPGQEQTWKFYYLYGLERVGRLSGQRFLGQNDWYREGARLLVSTQDPLRQGFWRGVGTESDPLVATSFAVLFLAKGRAPVLMNKLRHGPGRDWNNDVDDVRNLVSTVSRDWKNLLTWQVSDPGTATVADLMQAPIAYFNGHEPPVFSSEAKSNLRSFVEQGGFIFAEACCGRPEFDRGFRALMSELFPEPEYTLKPLPPEHAVWRARYRLTPDVHPLWGIDFGCRTVVVYSPGDLSCFWNQSEMQPDNAAVIKALRVGQNVVDYATGRELPADKLEIREVRDFRKDAPKRGALRIAKLRHAGDWNVAPLAIPNLTTALRDNVGFDVVINHKEIFPRDPNLVYYPLVYIHGRAALTFNDEDLTALRKHLDPGGGTLFADAACGSDAFDAGFRRFVSALLPSNPLVPIPPDDEIYTEAIGYDLSAVQFSKAAGGGKGRAALEGVKLNNRWVIIYSKLDLGCALERHQGLDCKGYTYESALKIAVNIVKYATLP